MTLDSRAALICGTGALLDYLVKDTPDHERFREWSQLRLRQLHQSDQAPA